MKYGICACRLYGTRFLLTGLYENFCGYCVFWAANILRKSEKLPRYINMESFIELS